MVSKPHDKYFKKVLTERENAIDFIDYVLPQNVREVIDINSVTLIDNSFLNDQLEEFFSDVILECKLISGENAYITILIEHKSYADKGVFFQLLNYLGNAYLNMYRDKEKRIMIPLLYYHGIDGWEPQLLEEYFEDYPVSLLHFLPVFDIVFVDVNKMPDEKIIMIRNIAISSMMITQKYYTDIKTLILKINAIVSTYPTKARGNFIETYVVNLVNVLPEDVPLEEYIEIFDESIKSEVMTLYDKIAKEERSKGLEQGLEQGREQGREETIQENIIALYSDGLDLERIAKVFKLPKDYVQQVIQNEKTRKGL